MLWGLIMKAALAESLVPQSVRERDNAIAVSLGGQLVRPSAALFLSAT